MNIWGILGVAQTHDQKAIKRAYAAKLKVTRPDADPAGYQALRAAFDAAIRYAKHTQERRSEPSQPTPTIAPPITPDVVSVDAYHLQHSEPEDTGSQASMHANTSRLVPLDDEAHQVAPKTSADASVNPAQQAIDQALDLAGRFLARAEHGQATEESLAKCFEDAAMSNLDARYAFELAIAHGLATWDGESFPLDATDIAARAFSWHQQRPSENQLSALLGLIGQQERFAHLHNALVAEASKYRGWRTRNPQVHAAAALLDPNTEKLTRSAMKRSATVNELRKLVDQVQRHHPDITGRYLDLKGISKLADQLNQPRFTRTNIIASVLGCGFLVVLLVPAFSNIWLEGSGRYLIPENAIALTILIGFILTTAFSIFLSAYGPYWWRKTAAWRISYRGSHQRRVESLSFQLITKAIVVAWFWLLWQNGWMVWIGIAFFFWTDPLPIKQTLFATITSIFAFSIGLAIGSGFNDPVLPLEYFLSVGIFLYAASILFGIQYVEGRWRTPLEKWLWANMTVMGIGGAIIAGLAKLFFGN